MGQAGALPTRSRLWAEFLALYVGGPLVLAFLLPPTAMFTVLGLMTSIGFIILHKTPTFHWRELVANPGGVSPAFYVGFAVMTALVCLAFVQVLFPQYMFMLPRHDPGLWLMIMLLYPLVSALPQEVIYRPLFFRRYGGLFPGRNAAILANAAFFSLAHLMYFDPLVLAMTFSGGIAFAWAYAARGSFAAAVALHALAGQIVFTSGLGILFYSGAVQ